MLCLAATGLESGTKGSGEDFEGLSGVQGSCTSMTDEGALNPRAVVTSSPDNNNETHETPNYRTVWHYGIKTCEERFTLHTLGGLGPSIFLHLKVGLVAQGALHRRAAKRN